MEDKPTCTHCDSYAFYQECIIDGEIEGEKITLLFCEACEKPCTDCFCCNECSEIKCVCCKYCRLAPYECTCCQKCGDHIHSGACYKCKFCGVKGSCNCHCEDEEQEREEREKDEYKYWLEGMCGPFRCEDCLNPDCRGNC
jgi:hypothetical protein